MRRNWMLPILAIASAFSVGCKDKTEVDPGAGSMKFELTSIAFRDGETIPKLYTSALSEYFCPRITSGAMVVCCLDAVLVC